MSDQEVFGKKPRVQRTPPTVVGRESDTDSTNSEREKRMREEEGSPQGSKKQKAAEKTMDKDKDKDKDKDNEEEKRRRQERVMTQFRQRTISTGSNAGEKEEIRKLMEELTKLRKEKDERQEQEERRRNEAERPIRDRIGRIKMALKAIIEVVSKENAGKISVTRSDQQLVKQSVLDIQEDIIETLLGKVELYKEKEIITRSLKEAEERIRKLEQERVYNRDAGGYL